MYVCMYVCMLVSVVGPCDSLPLQRSDVGHLQLSKLEKGT